MKEGTIKNNSFSSKLLRAIALTGVVLLASSSPYFGLALIKNLKRENKKKVWKRFYASLDYLNRRGYVQILDRGGGKLKVKITRMGEDRVKHFDPNSIRLQKQETWDGKWRVIIFDVPVNKNWNRQAFTNKLKELGFIMIQKSVWAYPYECYEEIMLLRKLYEIERFVTYFEAAEIEDERDWRGRFNLSVQT
ncbi:MAG: hypothetical protein HYX20_02495 [Candidatus Yanofskybacteria bacterium]|nr:hypothetical protein [Candidatus Yanofskybacteria bacterium]